MPCRRHVIPILNALPAYEAAAISPRLQIHTSSSAGFGIVALVGVPGYILHALHSQVSNSVQISIICTRAQR